MKVGHVDLLEITARKDPNVKRMVDDFAIYMPFVMVGP
jgi:hypothetical protein